MSNKAPINHILERVEQMLDGLALSPQSSANFRSSCGQLDVYLSDCKTLLSAGAVLTVEQKNRVTSIIDLLGGLQKRAETRANIPASLQKYIAEQSD